MKFFIDTASIDEIREAASLGILDGVTTNPSLVSKEGKDFRKLLDEILEIVDGPVSAELIATDYKGILKEAREYASIHKNIVVKVPLIKEGLKAVKTLSGENINTNVTLCFSPMQALLAAKAGATYISPFIGRLDDINQNGIELIKQLRHMLDWYDFDTQLLAASIRDTAHFEQVIMAGADIATVPVTIFENSLEHQLTDKGMAQF